MKNLNEELLRFKYLMGNLNEDKNILSEALNNVDDDVDLIYNMFFKNSVDYVAESKMIKYDTFKKDITTTNILKNQLSIKAHELNPCQILINYGRNYYITNEHRMSVSVSENAIDITMDYDGSIEKTIDNLNLNDAKRYQNEFTEYRIKGSIHHEITHWLDDTLNNNHIKKFGEKRINEPNNKLFNNINVTSLERQAQIHNIKQLYNKYKDVWNQLSFDDMIDLLPSLNFSKKLPPDIKIKWTKDTKKRMHREGLLGKNMR